MELHFRVLKEPLGFIRIVQLVMAILAFTSTAGFSSKSSLRVQCMTTERESSIDYEFGYPFRLRYTSFVVPNATGLITPPRKRFLRLFKHTDGHTNTGILYDAGATNVYPNAMGEALLA
ncbi:synaptophysin-like [Tachypleus tridentatus]|uniref:synaptophysin-like n=1 Tax=Tachypleus tridentatus TaxID=6853 RepID=UPI003FD1BBF0